MADIKFTAVRGVFTKAGKIKPGQVGEAPREAVEVWLQNGAVKLMEIPDDKPAPRRRRQQATVPADD